jgi:hypothetical protein
MENQISDAAHNCVSAQISDYFSELKIKSNKNSALCCDAKIPGSLGSEGLFCFEATRLCVYIRPNKTGLSRLITSECVVRSAPWFVWTPGWMGTG